jgi:hypothetical protein
LVNKFKTKIRYSVRKYIEGAWKCIEEDVIEFDDIGGRLEPSLGKPPAKIVQQADLSAGTSRTAKKIPKLRLLK